MEIFPGVEAVDLALFLHDESVLIVSDFHLGFEDTLQKQGVLVPRQHYKQVIERLDNILKVKPKTIVINGDLKHQFGSISAQEWKEVLQLLDYLSEKCEKIVLVKGNHDTILQPIARKKGLEVVKEYRVGDFLVIHGDAIPDEPAKILIMGHEHPAVSLQMEGRTEKFKCFLVGKWKKSVLIVQPSFNLLVEGTDMIKERTLSPLLRKINDFSVFVVDDKKKEVRGFGLLGDLVRLTE